MKHVSRMVGSVPLTIVIVTLLVSSIPPLRLMVTVGKDLSAEETQARARELWEEAVAAKGGRERLHKISSLYVARIQPGGDRDYYFYAFPDYWFNYTYGGYREDIAKTVHNGRRDVTWWLPPSGEPARPRKSAADDASGNIVAQFTYLMVTRWMEPKPLRVRNEWLGLKRVSVVEVDANGWRVDYYLDPKTHLPIKVVASEGEIPRAKGERHKVVQFEDYVPINGVMMPQKVTHSWTSIPRKWQERVSYEINPSYDPQFFEHPPTARTTPESWRAKGQDCKSRKSTSSRFHQEPHGCSKARTQDQARQTDHLRHLPILHPEMDRPMR